MNLETQVKELPSIGPILNRKLQKLKIHKLHDLIYHIPFRYEKVGETKKISDVSIGELVSIEGKVIESKNIKTRYGKILTSAQIEDSSGIINAVWFNQPFLTKNIQAGQYMSFSGKVDIFSHRLTLINPEYELLGRKFGKPIHTKGLVPIYPETSGISSKWLRKKIREVLPSLLPKIKETLPKEILLRNNLMTLPQALWSIHFPKDLLQAESARHRLAFDELLITQLKSLDRRKKWKEYGKGIKFLIPQEKVLKLLSNLPFTLTNAQKRSLKEILLDLQSEKPMNRLLQGDVGSGKTIVAAIASYVAFLNGFQTALMAPTEILAVQHFDTIKTILEPFGVKIGIRTSTKKTPKQNLDIIVGTHALISNHVKFHKLALVIIDEQHRFGVKQRSLLRKKGFTPHLLTMTATPIPRSLALTFYGDLDVSIIDEAPPFRKKVKTFLVPKQKRARAYEFIEKQVKNGKQVFIIFPLIDPSETLQSVKAATKEYQRLKNEIFPQFSIGLLHGRVKPKEKEKTIKDFFEGKFDILVSTPVVEVGIDIPNATVMVIEGAERFGLASLHQLRGRVGRGSDQSYCLLFTESDSKQVLQRLLALEKIHVGLKLAELDLKIRGPGQMYGTAQSGLPEFKIADINDLNLVENTKREAVYLFQNLEKFKSVKNFIDESSLIFPD